MLIMHIAFLACFHAVSPERSGFSKNRHVIFLSLVALKLLVSLISHLGACTPRIVLLTHTHTQTDRTTTVTLAAHACRGLITYTIIRIIIIICSMRSLTVVLRYYASWGCLG